MVYADRRKTDVLIGGSIILFVIVGLYLLRTQQVNADDPPRSAIIPQTAFPSDIDGEPVLGVFEGITPCSNENPPIPQIAENLVCEQMIWKLTLYQDAATGNPTTYQLTSAYGLSQQGSTGLQRGGTYKDLEGKWATIQGTQANPNAVIYQLNPDDPEAAINFMKLDDNILHLLNQDESLMVGNAAWSYTLNRTDKRIVSNPAAVTDFPSVATLPPVTSEASSPGIFEGRIPCVETVMALHKISTAGCQRVKLRLTLPQNAETQASATFELLSVYVGTGVTQYNASGAWTILQGTSADPAALVYQLNPNGSQQPIFFLRADDNNLFLLDSDFNLMVGDALMSFTLSRAD
jgi:hypothetical protein